MEKSKIEVYLEEINNKINLDGIMFENVYFVGLKINDEEYRNIKYYKDSLIVFDELKKSKEKSGLFLIFTCACGVADDGGWEGVNVIYEDDFIYWNLEIDDDKISYKFDKKQYISEITKLENIINKKMNTIVLEPTQILYPESWEI